MRKTSTLFSVKFEKSAIESNFKLKQKCRKYAPIKTADKIYHNLCYKIKHLKKKKKKRFDLNRSHFLIKCWKAYFLNGTIF